MKTKRLIALVLVCLLICPLLAGCGDGIESAALTTEETVQTTATPETTAAPETTKAPETTAAPETTEAPQTTSAPETTEPPQTEAPTEEQTEAAAERSMPTEQTELEQQVQCTYILNTNSKKFHYPDCSSVDEMSEKNKKETTATREEIIAQGYVPCKRCNP